MPSSLLFSGFLAVVVVAVIIVVVVVVVVVVDSKPGFMPAMLNAHFFENGKRHLFHSLQTPRAFFKLGNFIRVQVG